MCGRFTLHHTWAEVHAAMSIIPDAEAGRNTPARYNITPTQNVLFLASHNGSPAVNEGRWWLVPHWADDMPKWKLFNARSEEAHDKASFRDAYKTGRCLVLADGYYEWTKEIDPDGEEYKQPHYIYLPDNRPFAFAGLCAVNTRIDDEPIISCTILTAAADPAIEHLHKRMPIILDAATHQDWIDAEMPVSDARELLAKNHGAELQSHRVSRDVSNTGKKRVDEPYLVEPHT